MADFAKFDASAQADDGADMQLVFPNGDIAEGVTIRVRGLESRALRDMAKEWQRREARGLPGDDEKRGMAMLVAVTLSWTGIEWDGEPMACIPANVEKLYGKHEWIARQVLAFASQPANFFRSPAGV